MRDVCEGLSSFRTEGMFAKGRLPGVSWTRGSTPVDCGWYRNKPPQSLSLLQMAAAPSHPQPVWVCSLAIVPSDLPTVKFKVQLLTTMAERLLREMQQFQFTRKATMNRSHVSLLCFPRHTPLQKEDLSVARGKITQYKVSVHSKNSGPVSTHISADSKNYTVPFGPGCAIMVQSCTSKGCSPPARISPGYTKGSESSFQFWSCAPPALTSNFCSRQAPRG